jgi:quercetin dioxygenase-like cupin family protein
MVNFLHPGMKPSVITNLKELAEYVPDSIVSRTLVKNDAGNITFFAFGQGQGLSKHSAPFNAFVQILDGQGTIIIDETGYTLNPGDSILMPANIPHAINATQNLKMLLIMLKS